MENFLASFLITGLDYVHIDHYTYEHVSLVEFFDEVLVAADEPRLCLVKHIDQLSVEDIENAARFGMEIAEKTRIRRKIRYQTLVFLVAGTSPDEDKIRTLLTLPAFKEGGINYQPVIVDTEKRVLRYNPWKIPFSFLMQLTIIKHALKKAKPEAVQEAADLAVEEQKTIDRIDSFHQALFHFKPYVTWSLLALNLLIWIIFMICYPETPADTYGLMHFGAKVNPLIWNGEIWRLITPAFLHSSFFHIFFNSIMLFFLGPVLESVFGRWRFLLIYLVSAVSGNLMSVACSPYFSAGSSSALFGLPGALALYNFTYRKQLPRQFYHIICLFLFFFFLFVLIISLQFSSIDNYAHLGGLLGGVLIAGIIGVDFPKDASRRIRRMPAIAAALYFVLLIAVAMVPYKNSYAFYYWVLGEQAAMDGNYAKAAAYLEYSYELDSKYSMSRNMLGKVYSKMGFDYVKKKQPDAALHYLLKAEKNVEKTDENSEILSQIYLMMGMSYDEKYNPQEAIRYFRYSLLYQPEAPQVRNQISEQYLILARRDLLDGNIAHADTNTRNALGFTPENEEATILLGKISYAKGDFAAAADIWTGKERNKIRPGTDIVLQRFIFGNLWYPEPVRKASSRVRKEAVQLNLEGERILLKTGNYHKALEAFERASAIDANYTVSLNNQARVELLLNDTIKAGELVEQSLGIDSKNSETWALQGMVLASQHRRQEAIQAFQRSLSLNPRRGEACAGLGDIYSQAGDNARAEDYWKKAVSLNQENVVWRIALARVYRDSGKMELFWREANTAMVMAGSQNRQEIGLVIRTLLSGGTGQQADSPGGAQ